jgi:hypothetical protein
MKKTDKTLENTIVTLLTKVCEQSLKSLDGFQWLTHLVSAIVEQLSTAGIKLPNIQKQIKFDSEEACNLEHAGKWNRRLK